MIFEVIERENQIYLNKGKEEEKKKSVKNEYR